jgi:hypothetical protein
VIDTEEPEMHHNQRSHKLFRFEAAWVKEENCVTIVENGWKECVEARGGSVSEAAKAVSQDLGDWSKNILGDLERRIKTLKKELGMCRRGNISQACIKKEQLLKVKLQKLEEQQEMYWRQRAKVHWLRNGDKNTKYFHKSASERKKRSSIKSLKKNDGSIIFEKAEIHILFSNITLIYSNQGVVLEMMRY